MTAAERVYEGRHAGAFIMTEGPNFISRQNVTIASGQSLRAGAVLGKITASGKYKAVDEAASDGSQTAVGILIDACDASAGDVVASIIARDAEVLGSELDFGAQSPGQSTAAIDELDARNIIVR